MLRNGYALAEPQEAETKQEETADTQKISPEVNEFMHMLQALQARGAKVAAS